MRIATYTVLLLCLVGISLLLTAVHTFCDLGDGMLLDGTYPPADAGVRGHFLWVFRTAQFWNEYPAVPPRIGTLFGTGAAVLVAAVAGLAFWQLRIRRRLPWLVVGLACLPVGPAVYAWGLHRLAFNTDGTVAGRSLALSGLATLYSLVICAGCCLLQFRTARRCHAAAQPTQPAPAPRPAPAVRLYDSLPALPHAERADCPSADRWPVPHVTHESLT